MTENKSIDYDKNNKFCNICRESVLDEPCICNLEIQCIDCKTKQNNISLNKPEEITPISNEINDEWMICSTCLDPIDSDIEVVLLTPWTIECTDCNYNRLEFINLLRAYETSC